MQEKSGNYFKIVSTRERQGIYFTVVPCQWETQSTLFWPEHMNHRAREELRSNATSIPEDHWVKYPCIVKCSQIESFVEALQIEKQLTKCLDTDAEEELFENYVRSKKQHAKATFNPIITDRNNMFSQEPTTSRNNSKVNILTHETIRPTIISPLTVVEPALSFPEIKNEEREEYVVRTLLVSADGTNVDMDNIVTEPSTTDIHGVGELDVIKNQITELRDDFNSFKNHIRQEIREGYGKVVLSVDKVFRILSTQNQINLQPPTLPIQKQDLLQNEKFPMETCDQICALEHKIRNNPEFREQLVEFLSKVGGRTGVEDGSKLAYKLVDILFKPEVLTNYSWTGVSRKKDEEKKPFQSHDGILGVFFDVISLADNRHTQNKNCSIFKDGILKHAKKRTSRKRRAVDNRLTVINDESIDQHEETSPDNQD